MNALDSQQMQEAESSLAVAYRNLDKGRKRLKTVKSLVFKDDDNAEARDEMSDLNYFKLRELQDKITYTNQEIAQLREQEANLGKYNEQ